MYQLLLIFIASAAASNKKYICTLNHTINLKADEIVFFESPEFPRNMSANEKHECTINFTKDLLTEETVLINLVFL